MIGTILAVGVLAVGAYAIYKNRATIEADLKVKFSAKLDAVATKVKADLAASYAKLKVDEMHSVASVKTEVMLVVDDVIKEIKAKL